MTMVKQQSLTSLVIKKGDGGDKTMDDATMRRRSCLSLNEQNLITIIRESKSDECGGSTGDLSSDDAGCCLSSSPSSSSTNHEDSGSRAETTRLSLDATAIQPAIRDQDEFEDNDTGIGVVSSASSPPSSAKSTLAPGVVVAMLGRIGSSSEDDDGGDDDEDDESGSNRRRTIIFDDLDSDSSAKAVDTPTSTATSTTATKQETTEQATEAAPKTKNQPIQHHARSSSYLEVASLSSVYSNYSQIVADFGGQYSRSGAVSPPLSQQQQKPQPQEANQLQEQQKILTSKPASLSNTVVQSTKSNSSSFSTFLGLFASKNKSEQPQQSKSNKFELITSKLFNLNKSPAPPPPSLTTKLTYSSSTSTSSSPSSPTTSLSVSPASISSASSSTSSAVTTKNPLFPPSAHHVRHQSNEHYQYHHHHNHQSAMTSSSSVASINEAILASTTSTIQVPNTVLIFENRPSNLPAKSQQEELKHRQEYEKMIEIAKKKELKEKELKMKTYQQQIRKEDFMANSLRIWNTEILPNWSEQKNSKRTNQLWWHGLPPPIRGKVWKLAIGNDLNLTEESYFFYQKKAKLKLDVLSKHEHEEETLQNAETSSVELIKLDVSRTFPQLCFFQKDGPYHQPLHDVLGAYACYNTKIGYVQGMSFLTAILLLNMEAPDAFICLANLLNNKYLLACFCMDQRKMNRYFRVHQILLEYNIPKLYAHFDEQKVKPDLYLIDWIFTLFSKSLPLDVMSRVWDVFFRDKKEEFLFRTALGILNMYKDTLLELDFIHIVKFLTKLPDNINATMLFKSIEQIETNIDDFSFQSLIDDCDNVY